MRKILVIDTCILCVYLKVPKMDDCGPDDDKWNFARVSEKIQTEIRNKSMLVLPMAALIETGNHIAQVDGEKFPLATELAKIMVKVASEEEPWAAFRTQTDLWNDDNLLKLAEKWPLLANQGLSIGDATIKDVAEFYMNAGYNVEILTGDKGLKAYEPPAKSMPRRRKYSF